MRDYELIGELGRGAYSTVYRARRLRDNLVVALKQLRLPPGLDAHEEALLLERFNSEAEAARNLNHPGIVSIIESGEDEGTYFIAFEYIEGHTLQSELAGKRRFKPREIASVGRQLAQALDYAHTQGVIHRDIKPANILLAPDGKALIMDFGVAKLLGSDTQGAEAGVAFVGTPQYSSPEQVTASNVDARTDIFSLGAVLYEMAAARPAFGGESLGQIIHRITSVQAEPLKRIDPTFPPALENVIFKCLAKDPAFRYQSAADLTYALMEAYPEPGAQPSAFIPSAKTHPSGEAVFIVTTGAQEGREIKLHPSITTIGRKTGDVTFPEDDALENQHAWVTHEEGGYFLYDAGTANGTFVSGKRVDRVGLNNGDEITLGRQRFIYSGPSVASGIPAKPLTPEDVLPKRKPLIRLPAKPLGRYWWVIGVAAVVLVVLISAVYLYVISPAKLADYYDSQLLGLYTAWEAAFVDSQITTFEQLTQAAANLDPDAAKDIEGELSTNGSDGSGILRERAKLEQANKLKFIGYLYMAVEKIQDFKDKDALAADLNKITGGINYLQAVEKNEDWLTRMRKSSARLLNLVPLVATSPATPGADTNRDRAAALLYKAYKAYKDSSHFTFDQVLSYFEDVDKELLKLRNDPKEAGFANYNLAVCYYFTGTHLMDNQQYYSNAKEYLDSAHELASQFEGRGQATLQYSVSGIDANLYDPLKLIAEIELSLDRLNAITGGE